MKSTFKVLFYLKRNAIRKDGRKRNEKQGVEERYESSCLHVMNWNE